MDNCVEEQYGSDALADLKARLEEVIAHENSHGDTILTLQTIAGELSGLLCKVEHEEHAWRDTFDTVQNPIFVHDQNHRIIRANEAYARKAGQNIRDVIGKPYWEVFPKGHGPLPQCTCQPLQKETLQSVEVALDNGETYLSRAFATHDAQGQYLYSVHILEDITKQRRLQTALTESAERYRNLFETAPDAIFLADADTGQLLDANPAAEHLIGRSHEEILAMHQSQLHPVDAPAVACFQKHVREGSPPPSEIPVLRADGREIPTEINAKVFQLDGRRVIQGVFRDITVRKHTEAELAKTANRLSLSLHLLEGIVESIPIRVFWKDRDSRFLGCNTLFARDAGLSGPDELIGKTDFDLGWKDQAALYREDDQRVMDAGVPKLGYEEPLATPDGKTIWRRTSKVPLRNDAREVIGIVGIYDDITRQKQAGQDLLLNESRLKEAQGVAHLGSWELDLVNNEVWWSEENYHIFGAEQGARNTYETFLDTVHPDDRAAVNKAYADSVANQSPYDIEHRLLMKDGSVKWVHERCKTFYDDEGKPLRSAGTTLDITARKNTEAQTARLGRILDNSLNEIYVFDADSLRFNLANEGARRNLGYSMAEMSELTPLDLKPEFTREAFDVLTSPLRADETQVAVFETMHQRKNGSLYPVEVHLQFSAKAVPPVFVATTLDITERRKADTCLRHSEAGLAEAQRLAHLGNWELDIDADRLSGSDEIYRIFELDAQHLGTSYQTFLSTIHPGDRERFDHAYRKSVETKRPFELTHRLLTPDGRIKYLRQKCETHYTNKGRPLRSVGTAQDITTQYLTAQALSRSNRALKAISACNSVLIHATNEAELLDNMCRVIIDEGGYRFAWIGYAEDGAEKRVRPVAHAGFEDGYLEHINITYADDNEYGRGPVGHAARHSELQVVHDTLIDPHFMPWREAAVKRGYRSVLSLPLKDETQRVFAVLSIYAAEPDAFDAEALNLMQELANDLAFGILSLRTREERNHYLQEHLKSDARFKQALVDTIRAMALTVEKRDPYTAGHQIKVAQLSVAIGRELEMDEDRLEGLRLGAMIHDIGKIYVPAEILNRPGRLSKPEFEIIKSHPAVGYDIIKDVRFPWPVADMVLQHHERMDGSGYPEGLHGDQIILEARILAVADVVEAITAHRPYRPAVGLDKALGEIETNRGTLYDPAVVDACLRLIRDKSFAFEENGKT